MDCHLELTLDHVAMSCVMSEYEDLRGNMQLCKGISASLKANFQRADSNYQLFWLDLKLKKKKLSYVAMIPFLSLASCGMPIQVVLWKWPQKHVWVKRQVSRGREREGGAAKKLHREAPGAQWPSGGPLQLVALPSTAPCGPRAGSCARLKCNQWRLNPVPHNQPEPPHNHCHAVKTRKTWQSSLRIQVLSHGHQVGIWGHFKNILVPYRRALKPRRTSQSSLTWAWGWQLRPLNSLLLLWIFDELIVWKFSILIFTHGYNQRIFKIFFGWRAR